MQSADTSSRSQHCIHLDYGRVGAKYAGLYSENGRGVSSLETSFTDYNTCVHNDLEVI